MATFRRKKIRYAIKLRMQFYRERSEPRIIDGRAVVISRPEHIVMLEPRDKGLF
jgi:hypothetical protein